ncbi:MAG: Ku protein [Calditrichia bacterium]
MARAIWKGNITFGLVNIPVTLYPAEQRSDLHFKLLDSRDKAQIHYERVNEVTGAEVPWNEIVKGFEYNDGNYVLMTDEDFKKAAPEASQTVEIEDFVDQDAIDYIYFDKPYYLVPGKKGEKGYVLFRETLQRTGKVGIARVVIRTREYIAAIIPMGDALLLNLLRYHQELRDPGNYDFPDQKPEAYKISKKEIDMAEKLVESMTSDWEPEKYKDEYRQALMDWIKTKAEAGEKAAVPEAKEPQATDPDVVNMMELLQQSVAKEAKNRKSSGKKSTASKSRKKTSKKS